MTLTPPSLLTFERVEAVYNGAIVALHGVDLVVPEGRITALLGANGAGKTTLLKAASNLLPAERGRVTAGRILFDGQDVTRASPADHVRAGMVQVLEGRHCFRSLTVEENLVTGALGRSSSRAETRADLDKVYALFPRLAENRRTPAGLTSGGEQQMTAIGRGLMSRPRLFILDEPSMGLAPRVVDEIFQALAALNRGEGLTLLVAEQNSAVALRFAHRATVIENGISVIEGAAADLHERDDIRHYYLGGAPVPPGPTANPATAKETAA
jgi:branched-chain amino acid transport system ATP-binding protein